LEYLPKNWGEEIKKWKKADNPKKATTPIPRFTSNRVTRSVGSGEPGGPVM
jgi:hypothetical protein